MPRLDVAAHAFALGRGDERAEQSTRGRTGSPGVKCAATAAAICSASASRARGTSIRVSALHVWPELRKHLAIPSVTAALQVGVVEDHVGRLAAELQRHPLDRLGGHLATRRPARVEPVNETMSTPGCGGERLADDRAGAADQVEHAGGQPDLVEDLGEQERVERRHLAGLEHDRAAGGERRARPSPRSGAGGSSTGVIAGRRRRPARARSASCRSPPPTPPRPISLGDRAEVHRRQAGLDLPTDWPIGMPTSWAISAAISSTALRAA